MGPHEAAPWLKSPATQTETPCFPGARFDMEPLTSTPASTWVKVNEPMVWLLPASLTRTQTAWAVVVMVDCVFVRLKK